MKTEVFVCDSCGVRTRLNEAKRHWCEVCYKDGPVEMRPVRSKKPVAKIEPQTPHRAVVAQERRPYC